MPGTGYSLNPELVELMTIGIGIQKPVLLYLIMTHSSGYAQLLTILPHFSFLLDIPPSTTAQPMLLIALKPQESGQRGNPPGKPGIIIAKPMDMMPLRPHNRLLLPTGLILYLLMVQLSIIFRAFRNHKSGLA